MTALAATILVVIRAESAYPPITVSGLARVLEAIGCPATEDRIAAALVELVAAGHAEVMRSAKLGDRFRVTRTKPGRDLSEPPPAA